MLFFLEMKPGNKHNGIEWVVDMTLAYPNAEAIDMPGICIGWWEPRNIHVHYRAYPLSDIPANLEGRTAWLYDRYTEKELILDNFYQHGSSLDSTDKQERTLPRVVRHEVPFDKVWFMIAYVFYAVSSYIFWLYIYSPMWYLLSYPVSFIW